VVHVGGFDEGVADGKMRVCTLESGPWSLFLDIEQLSAERAGDHN